MRNETERKDLEFYLSLRYPVTIHPDPDGGYVAEVEELPGCMTQAETIDGAFEAIEDARQLWIKTAYQEGQDIPLPRDMEEYSGKFIVRIPRGLHRNLVRAARREGASLNQYVNSLLAAGVQRDMLVEGREFGVYFLSAFFGSSEEPLRYDEIKSMKQEALK